MNIKWFYVTDGPYFNGFYQRKESHRHYPRFSEPFNTYTEAKMAALEHFRNQRDDINGIIKDISRTTKAQSLEN